MQDSQCQAHHLQILTSRRGRDISRLSSHIIDNALLQPGNQKVCAFVHNCVLDSGIAIKDDRTGSAFDIVDGCLDKCGSNCEGNSCGVDTFEKVGHFVRCLIVVRGSWEAVRSVWKCRYCTSIFWGTNALRVQGWRSWHSEPQSKP